MLKYPDIQVDNSEEAVVYMSHYMMNQIILFIDQLSRLNSVFKYADIQVDDSEEAVVYMSDYM